MLIYACLCHVNQFHSSDLFCEQGKFNTRTFSSTCTPLITVFAESGIVTENMLLVVAVGGWVANQFVKSWNVFEVRRSKITFPHASFNLLC